MADKSPRKQNKAKKLSIQEKKAKKKAKHDADANILMPASKATGKAGK